MIFHGNILSDISRLEVLIGGKRAGNNSAEITNEAADICRRLFQGGIMGIDVIRDNRKQFPDLDDEYIIDWSKRVCNARNKEEK